MAKLRLVKGSTSPTVRNFKSRLPAYLTYINSTLIIAILIFLLTK